MTLDVYAHVFEDAPDAVAVALTDEAANSVVVKVVKRGFVTVPQIRQNLLDPLGTGGFLVAPTGIDPVTSRFSVERSTN